MERLTSKTKMKKIKMFRSRLANCGVVIAAIVLTLGIVSPSLVSADQYSQQIQALQQQNSQTQQSIDTLQNQASSYQAQLDQLQEQISGIQANIASTQNQIATVQAQIAANQALLIQEKAVLDDVIKTMYVDGHLTTLEMLATSNNISDFATKEEYQNIVQEKIQDTLASIKATQATLKQQNDQLNEALASQEQMNAQLTSAEQQQNQLLGLNQAQQAQYNQKIQSNQAQIAKLQQEQLAALQVLQGNTSAAVAGGGGYPYGNAVCLEGSGPSCGDYNWGYPPSDYYDQWGYEYRNCTSYVAWKIQSVSSSPVIESLISYLGNASTWPENAAAKGVPVFYGDNPQVGDAVVDPEVVDGKDT